MNAVDVLARVLCDALVESPLDEPCEGCKVQAEAAVGAVRGMDVTRLLELRPDFTAQMKSSTSYRFDPNDPGAEVVADPWEWRAVGPWEARR